MLKKIKVRNAEIKRDEFEDKHLEKILKFSYLFLHLFV